MASDEADRSKQRAPAEPKSADDPQDPLEQATQSMSTGDRAAVPIPLAEDADTTTWAGSGPPTVVDEDATVVSPVPSGDPVDDPDDTETLIAVAPVGLGSSDPIAPSSSLRPMLLERIEPTLGRGERLRLDAAHWRVSLGRAEESDVRLYTASASREHACIAGSENGQWVLTPASGKSVLIDGEPVSESIVLEVGMNLVLGQDHLRCVTEGLEPRAAAAATVAGETSGAFEGRWHQHPWARIAAGVVTLIGLLWALFAARGD